MPESPAVSDELEVELPHVEVPLRDGERERYGAIIDIEDVRIRESIMRSLNEQYKALTGSEGPSAQAAMATKYAVGATAKQRQRAKRQLSERLKKETYKRGDRWEGPCVPFTVINFNPVPVSLVIEGTPKTIPIAGKGNVITIGFRGRKFVGSYMLLDSPYIWGAHTGTQNDSKAGGDMPKIEFSYIPPAGLAHNFYEHFVSGANDAQGMGGIVVFEGDVHGLVREMKVNGDEARIWVPRKELTLDGMGDAVFTVEMKQLSEVMEESVNMQALYSDKQISEGHSYSTSQADAIRNMLSNYHRTWHNFSLAMGYIDKALPWAVERMNNSPKTQAVLCPNCQQRQATPEQWFCPNCNSAFDPLAAYLAGKNVPPADLTNYEGEEWDAIVAESKRRSAKMAIFNAPDDAEAPKPRNRKPKEGE